MRVDDTVETATVTALLDHHRAPQSALRDGIIQSCNNKLISIFGNRATGYRQVGENRVKIEVSTDSSSPNFYKSSEIKTVSIILPTAADDFDFPFRYQTPREISYDEHTGYDYSILDQTTGEERYDVVVAAASGKFNFSASRKQWNEIVLDHDGDIDHQTQYWHLASWEKKFEDAYRDKAYIEVSAGEPLGRAGGAARNGTKPDGSPSYDFGAYPKHLHFEVWRYSPVDGNVWVLADPYGKQTKDGTPCQPRLWK